MSNATKQIQTALLFESIIVAEKENKIEICRFRQNYSILQTCAVF